MGISLTTLDGIIQIRCRYIGQRRGMSLSSSGDCRRGEPLS
jgi:hypothetical protein